MWNLVKEINCVQKDPLDEPTLRHAFTGPWSELSKTLALIKPALPAPTPRKVEEVAEEILEHVREMRSEASWARSSGRVILGNQYAYLNGPQSTQGRTMGDLIGWPLGALKMTSQEDIAAPPNGPVVRVAPSPNPNDPTPVQFGKLAPEDEASTE